MASPRMKRRLGRTLVLPGAFALVFALAGNALAAIPLTVVEIGRAHV